MALRAPPAAHDRRGDRCGTKTHSSWIICSFYFKTTSFLMFINCRHGTVPHFIQTLKKKYIYVYIFFQCNHSVLLASCFAYCCTLNFWFPTMKQQFLLIAIHYCYTLGFWFPTMKQQQFLLLAVH
jgi:hypothetical protein